MEGITTQELHSLTGHLRIKTPEGRACSSHFVTMTANSLIHKGFLVASNEPWGRVLEIIDDETKEYFSREAAAGEDLPELVDTIQEQLPRNSARRWQTADVRQQFRLIRDFRLGLYLRNLDRVNELSKTLADQKLSIRRDAVLCSVFSSPFQTDFLIKFPAEFQTIVIKLLLKAGLERMDITDEYWNFIKDRGFENGDFREIESLEKLFKGDLNGAKERNDVPDSLESIYLQIVISALEKDYAAAILAGETATKLWRKGEKKKKGFPEDWRMIFYGIAVCQTSEPKFHQLLEEINLHFSQNQNKAGYVAALNSLAFYLKNNDQSSVSTATQLSGTSHSERLTKIIISAISTGVPVPPDAKEWEEKANKNGYRWLSSEIAKMRERKGIIGSESNQDSAGNGCDFQPVGQLFPILNDWERTLHVLETLRESNADQNTGEHSELTRVIWQIDFERKKIQPMEQKFSANGWTAGRNIALRRLSERDVEGLTEQDLDVLKNALTKATTNWYYGGENFEFDWRKSLLGLVGHPNLFNGQPPHVSIQLVGGEPTLFVRERGENFEISVDIDAVEEGIAIIKETATRFKIYEVTREHLDLAGALNGKKVVIPAEGRNRLISILQGLAGKVTIASELEEHLLHLPERDAENRLHALFTPQGNGYQLEFLMKPFGDLPPYFKPGQGTETVVTEVDGIPTRTKRDLNFERELVAEIEAECPFLADFETPNMSGICGMRNLV